MACLISLGYLVGAWLCGPLAAAGPYAPAAGQPGTTAIAASDPRITGWARGIKSSQPGTQVVDQWIQPLQALHSASTDALKVTSLGSGGQITLSAAGVILDGPGADFCVFENGIIDGFLELAYVEVSQDGVTYHRFPGHSLTTRPVGAFDSIDPTQISGLGSKYRVGFGEPYDLSTLGLEWAAYVRVIDIPGDGSQLDAEGRPIYDPYPVTQSAGFDLDGLGVIHGAPWWVMAVDQFQGDGANSAALSHLPDGRVVWGLEGRLRLQTTWGRRGSTSLLGNGVFFDPSFIAIRDEATALVGQGGSLGETSGVHLLGFSPASPGVSPTALRSLQNYAGAWRGSPLPGHSGWIIAGAQPGPGPTPTAPRHRLTWLSPDGIQSVALTQDLSTYSGGVAVGPQGDVWTALYELPGSPESANAHRVLQFDAEDIDAVLAAHLALPSGASSGTTLRLSRQQSARDLPFRNASTIAIDSLGRVWAAGYQNDAIEAYAPASGARAFFTSPEASRLIPGPLTWYASTYLRGGQGFVAFLGQSEFGSGGSPLVYGMAPVDTLTWPLTYVAWATHHDQPMTGWTADTDNDSIPSLVEYALGLNPQQWSHAGPFPSPAPVAGSLWTFTRNPLASEAQLIVEMSDTLTPGSWLPLAHTRGDAAWTQVRSGFTLREVEHADGRRLVSLTLGSGLVGTGHSVYLRLRATYQPTP